MLKITQYNSAFQFQSNLIYCWLFRKIKGGKTKKNGYNCGNSNCEICTSKINQEKDFPSKLETFLLKGDNIKVLSSGNPVELIKLYDDFEKIKLSKKDKKKYRDFFIKGYENWFQPNYGKHFLDLLNIDTCIYCNRNYTINLVKDRTRAELDHWFPKERFPLLALSFYNLIPSCHSCNHIKGNPNIDWKNALNNYIHPYRNESNEDFKFTFFYDDTLDILTVETNAKKGSKRDKTIIANKILEIYNSHSEKELRDLYNLVYKYSDNYIKILIDDTFDKKLNMSKEEIYRMIFGIETKEEDYHKRPFSKFKHDIIEELKNIK
jgi:hypothetical protein